MEAVRQCCRQRERSRRAAHTPLACCSRGEQPQVRPVYADAKPRVHPVNNSDTQQLSKYPKYGLLCNAANGKEPYNSKNTRVRGVRAFRRWLCSTS